MSEPIKVTVRHLGETRVDVANITPPKRKPLNPLAAAGVFRPVRDQRYIPCTTYVIEHPKGLIVVDTGIDKRVRSHPVLELTAIHNQINKPIRREGQAVDEVLASMGIQPSDIKYLLLSHLHSDHANGARQLIGAEHIVVCSKDELDGASKDDLVTKATFLPRWRRGLNLETFAFEDTGLGPVGQSYDLFGTLIRNNGKQLLLGADCGYTRAAYQECIVPFFASDKDGFRKSLNWEKEIYDQPETLDVLVNHDIAVLDNTQFVL